MNWHLITYLLSVNLTIHSDIVLDVKIPRGKCLQIDWFPSPREASQELNVLYHECLYIRMLVVSQGIQ